MKTKIKKINILDKIGDSIAVQAEFIGAGAFAKCYIYEGRVYSFVNTSNRENDYSKEAVSLFADENNIHIPQILKEGDYENDNNDYGLLFSMPYYEKLTASHKIAWNQYKTIESAWNKIRYNTSESGYNFNCEIIESLRGKIDESIIEALESINQACTMYSLEYQFEFPKMNLKVDSDGNLILLDVIFNKKAMQEKRQVNKRF